MNKPKIMTALGWVLVVGWLALGVWAWFDTSMTVDALRRTTVFSCLLLSVTNMILVLEGKHGV